MDAEAREANQTPLVDWEKARRDLPGGEEELREVIGLVLQDCPQRLEAARVAVAAGSAQETGLAIHSLKGAVKHFGAYRLVEYAEALERHGYAGELETVRDGLPKLDTLLNAFLSELRAGDPEPPPDCGDQ